MPVPNCPITPELNVPFVSRLVNPIPQTLNPKLLNPKTPCTTQAAAILRLNAQRASDAEAEALDAVLGTASLRAPALDSPPRSETWTSRRVGAACINAAVRRTLVRINYTRAGGPWEMSNAHRTAAGVLIAAVRRAQVKLPKPQTLNPKTLNRRAHVKLPKP